MNELIQDDKKQFYTLNSYIYLNKNESFLQNFNKLKYVTDCVNYKQNFLENNVCMKKINSMSKDYMVENSNLEKLSPEIKRKKYDTIDLNTIKSHNNSNSKSTWVSQKFSNHSNDSYINGTDKPSTRRKNYSEKNQSKYSKPLSTSINHYSMKELIKEGWKSISNKNLQKVELPKSRLSTKKDYNLTLSHIIKNIKKAKDKTEINLSHSNYYLRSLNKKTNEK